MRGPTREGYVRDAEIPWRAVRDGMQQKILGYDRELMLVRVRLEKGFAGPVHRHPHRQVTYVESGLFEVQLGAEKKTLGAGDSFFVPPDTEHCVAALESGILVDVFTPAREDFLDTKA